MFMFSNYIYRYIDVQYILYKANMKILKGEGKKVVHNCSAQKVTLNCPDQFTIFLDLAFFYKKTVTLHIVVFKHGYRCF